MKKALLLGFGAIITFGMVPIHGSAQGDRAPTWTADIGPPLRGPQGHSAYMLVSNF